MSRRLFPLLAGLLLLTGCSQTIAGTPVAAPPPPLPKIEFSVADGQRDVSPRTEVSLSAPSSIERATLTNQKSGKVIPLQMDGDRAKLGAPLAYGAPYKLSVKLASDRRTQERSFTTVTPRTLTHPTIGIADGAQIGTALPITLRFDEAIRDRAAAERLMQVQTDPPVAGKWRWFSDREARWRPENFWRPGTKVRVNVPVYGESLGAGLFGQDDVSSSFTVGEGWGVRISDRDKQVRVFRNGQQVKVMPTSLGKPGHETPSGTYYVGQEKNRKMVMDSSTYGVTSGPDAYRTEVEFATRISSSGIFVHAAPWSVPQQGKINTSHGCANVSTEDGRWFLENVPVGTPVVVEGTPVRFDGTDGMGDWMIPWDRW